MWGKGLGQSLLLNPRSSYKQPHNLVRECDDPYTHQVIVNVVHIHASLDLQPHLNL